MISRVMIVFMVLLPIVAFSQKSRIILGEDAARKILEETLTDKKLHNVIRLREEIVSDSLTAVTIAETILFKIYGKKEVLEQMPYEIYKIKDFWYISGTLPQGWVGGTFLFIMDARDGKVIRISHGK